VFCSLKSLGYLFSADYMKFFGEGSWHPVVTGAQVITGAVFGSGPFAFHLLNFSLHLLCSFLTGWCAFYLFRNRAVALAASVIFLAHPLHVEPLIVATFNEDLFAAVFRFSPFLRLLKRRELRKVRPCHPGFLRAFTAQQRVSVFFRSCLRPPEQKK